MCVTRDDIARGASSVVRDTRASRFFPQNRLLYRLNITIKEKVLQSNSLQESYVFRLFVSLFNSLGS